MVLIYKRTLHLRILILLETLFLFFHNPEKNNGKDFPLFNQSRHHPRRQTAGRKLRLRPRPFLQTARRRPPVGRNHGTGSDTRMPGRTQPYRPSGTASFFINLFHATTLAFNNISFLSLYALPLLSIVSSGYSHK